MNEKKETFVGLHDYFSVYREKTFHPYIMFLYAYVFLHRIHSMI